jgi:hypothetical protein
MKRLSVLGLVLVASCASGPRTFPLPDGRTGYLVECNGSANSIASCYSYAAEVCGGKYEVVGQDSSTGIVAVNGIVGPLMKRSVQFTCPA